MLVFFLLFNLPRNRVESICFWILFWLIEYCTMHLEMIILPMLMRGRNFFFCKKVYIRLCRKCHSLLFSALKCKTTKNRPNLQHLALLSLKNKKHKFQIIRLALPSHHHTLILFLPILLLIQIPHFEL